MNVNGASLGMGLTRTLPALETGDPVALANVLYAASYDTNPRFRKMKLMNTWKTVKTWINCMTEL